MARSRLTRTPPAGASAAVREAFGDWLAWLDHERRASPHTLDAYARAGFPPFAAEWQRRHAYQGKPVKLLLPDGASVKGTVAGVDSTGALVLADGPRRARFLAGEISLRRA